MPKIQIPTSDTHTKGNQKSNQKANEKAKQSKAAKGVV
jgi:hypothetical protein